MSFTLPLVDQRIPDLFCPGELVPALPALKRLRPRHLYALRVGSEWITATFENSSNTFQWRAMRAGTQGSGSKRELELYLAELRGERAA